MARQVLPWVGAAVGAYFGGPQGAQIGYMIGSVVGNAVDPVEMQGRKLGDAPSQVAAEGGARAIVFGKGCIRGTCILERGGRRVIKQRDSSGGKGSGPTTVNERALWTFSIGLGEAIPGGAILRIWEQEKLVYDVTPESTIPAESAAFAEKFRFYDGSEDQLPDPAIEAIHDDPEDAPYYRGTAYIVFPQRDLTDFGEAVPTYRIEIAAAPAPRSVDVMAFRSGSLASSYMVIAPDWTGAWDDSLDLVDSTEYALEVDGRIIAYDDSNPVYTDTIGAPFIAAAGDPVPSSGGVQWGWADGDDVVIGGGVGQMIYSPNRGGSYSEVPGSPFSSAVCKASGRWLSLYHGSGGLRYATNPGGPWSAETPTGLAITAMPCRWSNGSTAMFAGAVGFPHAPGLVRTGNGEDVFPEATPTFASATVFTCIHEHEDIWVAGTDSGEIAYRIGGVWQLSPDTLGVACKEITHNGDEFVMIGGDQAAGETHGFIKTSPTGENWTTRFTSVLTPGERWSSIVRSGDGAVSSTQVALSTVLAALHTRCGHGASDYDVSEATDLLSGVVVEQTVTGAEAINSIIGGYFIDPAEYDGEIHYIKRGKPVVRTLTVDDLIDEPESNQRKNAIEYPLKVHFFYQGSAEAYASPKATSSRYSKDLQNVGEVSVSSPVTFDDGLEPAQIVAKIHKVLWAQADGEIVWHVTDEQLDLVPTDCLGLSYNGQLVRVRITQIEDDPGQRKLKMVRDRQSAYTANITEIPVPPAPTPPQPSISSPTILAMLDIPALTDDADFLHELAAMSGSTDNWAGAALQRSRDDGANFDTIDSVTQNAIIGLLQAPVAEAEPYYTDTTNTVVVRLYTDDDLHSISYEQLLSEGNPFALSWMDGDIQRWEVMQFQDAEQDSNGDWVLSTLLRGRLNTLAAEHPVGAMFVLLDGTVRREITQTAWLGQSLVHRAPSIGQSPEAAVPQALVYEGNSQREWPVALLTLERDGDDITAEAVPRHRFGTSMNPIRSLNHSGFRWIATDGSNTLTADTDSNTTIWTFDATGWASPVSVSVAQLNRLTGAGPYVTEGIA